MITLFYWLVIIALLAYIINNWMIKKVEYFKKQGIPSKRPSFSLGFFSKSLTELMAAFYNSFPDAKIIGSFEFGKPFYLLRDPEIIKQLTVKKFDHFTDRRVFDSGESLLSSSLSLLKGQKWKDMRTTLSPAFTGSKMRQMFVLINECSQDFVQYFLKNSDDNQIIDMEDTFSRYTNDSIATCAFGITVNSLKDRNNEFYTMGNSLMNPNQFLMMIKILVIMSLPKLATRLNIQFFDPKVDKFFRSLIMETMATREKEKIFRPDMINLLMQIRKGGLNVNDEKDLNDSGIAGNSTEYLTGANSKTEWTDDEIVAQCLLFFLAGFTTSSMVLSTISYELATNPDVQDRLLAEIDAAYEECNGAVTYETVHSVKYLDMVVSETLRKWSPAAVLERVCVKPFSYEVDEIKLQMEEGIHFVIPVTAVHHDPKHFPNPGKFDPERFSDANVDSITPFTYFPFGLGPRSCIASRFALMQMKTVIFNTLKSFTFEVCEKTQIPLKLKGLFIKPEKGIHLRLKRRE